MAAAPLLVAALLIFLASSIAFIIAFAYIKRRRLNRRERPAVGPAPLGEPEDEMGIPPTSPQPPPRMASGEEVEKQREDARRKKRGRKKRMENRTEVGRDGDGCSPSEEGKVGGGAGAELSYPFSSFASAAQRKIKLQYDQLVKSNQDKGLTMAQVGQFVNCLVEARKELQHKSENIQRSFKIKKALLFKADRSSFDRLCQQIYKLEAEYKRLEEDAAVYNLLQEQLKLSPAYKTMVEVSSSMELKDAVDPAIECSEISFEELLAQEKKDSFWQRNGRLRSVAS
ncbi:hypothetical protein AXF42_Ash005231 [Apostasia shenzhenica]|uniref:Uncharacterized protein n=1 Tax=Apostasia shenzhenica TaxID=1088818 RepID=A0A2I0B6B6_9ASPA|nr:hypothetical protein AXF42_Ash005231 [Apostasia shenzhenica]